MRPLYTCETLPCNNNNQPSWYTEEVQEGEREREEERSRIIIQINHNLPFGVARAEQAVDGGW